MYNNDKEANANYQNGAEMVGFSSSQIALAPGDIKFDRERFCFSKRCLAVFMVIFLLTTLVFVGLYAHEKLKSKPCLDANRAATSSGQSTISPSPTSTAWYNGTVYNGTATDLLKAMNRSVDPCDDFYQYACGGWKKNNPIPSTRSSWSQFRMLYERNEKMMKNLITSTETREKYKENEALRKAFAYYDACIDTDTINKLGKEPLVQLIDQYGSWNVTNKNWTVANWNFMDVFSSVHKYLSIAPLFNMFVGTDLKDSTKTVIVFDQSGTLISREALLYNTTYHKKIRDAYRTIMTKLMKKLGAGDQAEQRMEEVYAFEKELASNMIPKEQRRDSEQIYNKMPLSKLISEIGNSLNLTQFLDTMFNGSGTKINPDEDVVVYALEYMKNVSRIFAHTDKRIIANYMMWHVVWKFAPSLSEDFRELYYQFRQAITGTRGEDPRWQDCTSSVSGTFGMAIGLLFVDKTFEGESKRTAEKMIHDIRKVFIDNLKNIEWMDDETRKVAKQKAVSIRENIGYPNYITNETKLAKDYDELTVNSSTYFWNIYNQRKYFNLKNYKQLRKPVDKTKWSMTPPTVNAYYSSTDNKIAFPAGILQKPFYSSKSPQSLNYGGIGMVVGHEITHGFDDNGRKFNKDGNLKKWWTNSSIKAFETKTKCLVKQYSQYKFHGKNLNGEQTLGENIADNGGIKQSFQAYQMWKKANGEEKPLPGLDLSHDQLFFLSFAQIWCSSYRPYAAIRAVENGVHSPGQWRVIGSLSNSKEFADAYKCKVGSNMNPVKKCAVW